MVEKEGNHLKFFKTIFICILAILILSSCGKQSLKEASKTAGETVKTTFNEDTKKPNKKSGEFQFYLPFGYEINDKSPNNIILKNGSKTFILFNNPQEDSASEVVYKATVAQYKHLDTNERFKKNNELGFILVKHLKDDLNELTVGIGGTKMTTQTKTSSLAMDTKTMMQIVHSIKK